MAFHLTTIRNLTQAKLVAAGIAGGRVEPSRNRPFEEDELAEDKVILFLTGAQMQGAGKVRPFSFEDQVQVVIQYGCRAVSAPALVEKLELGAGEILQVLLTDAEWGKLFEQVSSIDLRYEVPETGKANEGAALIVINASYTSIWTKEHADDLRQVRAEPPSHGVRLDDQLPGERIGFSVDLPGAS